MTSTIVRNNTKSKSALFLLELIIAIMFFALSSVICIQLFVKAHTISKNTSDLNMAVIRSESIAEVFKAVDGDSDKLEEILNPIRGEDGSYHLYYDSNWGKSETRAAAEYTIRLNIDFDSALKTAEVSVWGDAGEKNPERHIYTLTVKKHTGREALK